MRCTLRESATTIPPCIQPLIRYSMLTCIRLNTNTVLIRIVLHLASHKLANTQYPRSAVAAPQPSKSVDYVHCASAEACSNVPWHQKEREACKIIKKRWRIRFIVWLGEKTRFIV